MSQQVKIHQVVVLNISDHYTRNRLQQKGGASRVSGALLGYQEGRTLNIIASFEIATKHDKDEEITAVDFQHFKDKVKLMKEVYKTSDLVGWYSTTKGLQVTPQDVAIHKNIVEATEKSLLYLTFDPNKQMTSTSSELPLKLHEFRVEKRETESVEKLIEIPFDVEGPKTENIAIEHVTRNVTAANSSVLAAGVSSTSNAVEIMKKKLGVLLELLETKPEIAKDPEIMQDLKDIIVNLPNKNEDSYKESVIKEYTEASLINLLTSVLVANKTIQDVVHLKPGFDLKGLKFLDI